MSCNAKKDPNGTWRIQYRWTDWTGAKKKSQKRGFKTKKEAEEWYAHFLLQQSSDPTMTLADFWEIYKADMEKRLRKTTMVEGPPGADRKKSILSFDLCGMWEGVFKLWEPETEVLFSCLLYQSAFPERGLP